MIKKNTDHLYEADKIILMDVDENTLKLNLEPKDIVPSIKLFIKDLIMMKIHPKLKKYLMKIIALFY